jgi:signal transduction histidine kinase
MRVLIVDDIPSNLRLLRAMLEEDKLDVVEAPDGVQALDALERQSIDAIISDVLMPRMDGYRLCQEVRKSERWRMMPFIFYTATYDSVDDEKLCYDLGGDKYLRKPSPREVLLAALSEAASAATRRPPNRAEWRFESDDMREYSERLVCKWEEKHEDLARRSEELEQARADLQHANLELESRVQQRTAELRVANHELEAFSYSVSHDLRAPLRHIGGYIEILLRNCTGQLSEINRKHLQTVSASARMMGELIDALLELSKVTRIELHRSVVDLSALAAEVFADLRESDPSRAVKLEITPGMNANGDPQLLRIVLVNLLGNAWKYSRKRADARIEFGKTTGAAVDTYFVRDNGAGFDMAYAGKLFGAFQRLHGQADFEGIGIGLATVQRIIHRHSGKISGESIDHQGATFRFTLSAGDLGQPDAAS